MTNGRLQRYGQRNIFPQSVSVRAFNDVIKLSETGSASTSLGNGDQVVITNTLSQKYGARLLSFVDISVYVDSVATTSQLPGGTSIDESNWQVIGPWYDWAATDGQNVKILLYIRNISAGSVTLYIRTQHRYIVDIEGVE